MVNFIFDKKNFKNKQDFKSFNVKLSQSVLKAKQLDFSLHIRDS